MTFSVVARDPVTGDLGVAAQSKFLAVGSVVTFARATIGAVATQALANVSYGERGLDLLAAGATAAQALDALLTADERPQRRQAGIVDAEGRVAAHTGAGCGPYAGHVIGDYFSCQGNMLVSHQVLEAMCEVMTNEQSEEFSQRLVTALDAGEAAGGDERGQQSASLLVVRPHGGYGGYTDRLVDLRVDDHAAPIAELQRLLKLHELYFGKPSEDELLPLLPLLPEIVRRLKHLGVAPRDEGMEAVWAALERWAGRENLEERMVRPGAVDQTVLNWLRRTQAREE